MTDVDTPPRPSFALRLYRVLAVVSMVLVLILAVMAGRSLFGSWDIVVHGHVGNSVFAIAVVMVVLSFMTQARGVVVGHAVAFAALTFVQIGLGYVGRESAEAASWHIPNGVLLMAIATAHVSLLRPDRA